MTGFYETQLIIITCICVISLLVERVVSKSKQHQRSPSSSDDATPGAMTLLSRQYLLVYAIVMGADWLQGAYVYSLYREQYAFPERIVAVLFVTGFLSAGISAPLVGVWADQHGRRFLCLVFCVTYATACACITVPWLPVLLLGRLLGGFSTSILFSAFETWVISAANILHLPQSDLSTILGRATLVNAFVGTASGIISNQLVSSTKDFASPFIASGAVLVIAWTVIKRTWTENYGASSGPTNQDIFQLRRLAQAWSIVKNDPRLLVIGLTQTCFEGSMYIFVFQWVPLLQEASDVFPYELLPLGYIFSAFMMAMMLGSIFYTSIVTHIYPPDKTSNSSLLLHAQLNSVVCALSALSFAASIGPWSERVRFWAFCTFEACVGMYYPIQGMLRGTLISNEHRATLSASFRIPLNVFVVVSLLTGTSDARYAVMSACSLMLGFSSIMTAIFIVGRHEEPSGLHAPSRI